MKRLTTLVFALLLAGCATASEPRRQRTACEEAIKYGWCVTGCDEQPLKCTDHLQTCIGCGR